MSYTEDHIVKSYTGLFSGLSTASKLELIEQLTESVNLDETKKDLAFFNSFGAFASKKEAEEIIREIKENRKFKHIDLKL